MGEEAEIRDVRLTGEETEMSDVRLTGEETEMSDVRLTGEETEISDVRFTGEEAEMIAHLRYTDTDLFCVAQDIIRTHVLTKFHIEWTIHVTLKMLRPLATLCFTQRDRAIFELVQDITRTNLLTKFHDDRTITFAAVRMVTRKTTLPPSGHVFQPTGIIFELVKYIIGTNRLIKFHEDRTTNVATRMQTRQMLTPHNAQRTKDDPDDDEVPVTRPRNTHMSHDWEPGTNQQGAGWERAF
ncbi:hypothetical protein DPMN_079432 [Dreissena polymorpha]|uniref:Uncharacterized protein n=1 Tax=Dreissena polymorpha TaxID=45954 RepID=A0A9D3YQR1_DREPO|nr:hypothetical protein DPMN_079432 [Dreissena polymorpha]